MSKNHNKTSIPCFSEAGVDKYVTDHWYAFMGFMAFYPSVAGKTKEEIKKAWIDALEAATYCGVVRDVGKEQEAYQQKVREHGSAFSDSQFRH